MNLFDKVKKYVNGEAILEDWVGDGGIVVSQATAQSRTDTCLKCSMNEAGFLPADLVAAAIKSMVELKNNLNLKVRGEKKLFTCSACECPLKTKVWVPIDYLTRYETDEEREAYDEKCWILSELK